MFPSDFDKLIRTAGRKMRKGKSYTWKEEICLTLGYWRTINQFKVSVQIL
jgi:hypothetical protein